MATAAYKSTLTAGGTAVKDLVSIDWPLKMNTDDTTSFSATTPGAETSIPTTYGTQIKLSGNRNSSDTGQNNIRTAWINRTTVALVYDIMGDSTETYTATCYCTDWGVKGDPKKAAKFDATLVATGAITIV